FHVTGVQTCALPISAAAQRLEAAVEATGYAAFLLAGMTGSGKTEVYLRAARAARDRGRGVLLLVPEIALVPALARTVRERFGARSEERRVGEGGESR